MLRRCASSHFALGDRHFPGRDDGAKTGTPRVYLTLTMLADRERGEPNDMSWLHNQQRMGSNEVESVLTVAHMNEKIRLHE